MHTITVASSAREEMLDITGDVEQLLRESEQKSGVCVLFVQHTTCGLTVNENADPDVQSDVLGFLKRLIPQHEPHFKHAEENSDAHIKSSLVGTTVTVPFENGRLALGRWQAIYVCEFDGPRQRKLVMTIL